MPLALSADAPHADATAAVGRALSVGLAGVTVGAVALIRAVSVAAVIFAGAGPGTVQAGIGAALAAHVAVGGWAAAVGAYRGTIASAATEPAAVLAIMLAAAAPAGGPGALGLCALAALVVGTTLWLLGRFKLGNLVRFLPFPVVGGFLAGIGWVLAKGGLAMVAPQPLTLGALIDGPRWDLAALLPAAALAAALLVVQRKLKSRVGVPVLLLGSVGLFHAGTALAGLDTEALRARGLLLAGTGDGALWQPAMATQILGLDPGAVWPLLPQLGTVALISALTVLLLLSGLEAETRTDIDVNAELRRTGVANLVSGLAGGLPGYLSMNLTVLGRAMAPPSRGVGLVAAAVCLAAAAGGSRALTVVPVPVVSGLVLSTGIGFLMDWCLAGARRFDRLDRLLIPLVLGATILGGFLTGIAVGLVGAVVLLTVRLSLTDVVKLAVGGDTLHSTVQRPAGDRALLRTSGRTILVLRLEGTIFFGTAAQLLERVRRLTAETPELRFLVLDGKRVGGLDASAAQTLARLAQALGQGTLVLTGFRPADAARLARAGLGEGGPAQRFDDLDHALEWCEDRLLTAARATTAPAPALVEELQPYLAYAERFEAVPGTVLMRQGERSDDIFLIEDGLLTVCLEAPGRPPIRLRTLLPGTVVGEVAFYLQAPRTASVIAEAPSRGWRLGRAALGRMLAENPDAAVRVHATLARLLAERVTDTNLLIDAALY